MTYTELLIKIAEKNKTTPKEVDMEIRKALKLSKLNIEPSEAIAMAAEKVKKTIYRN